MALDFRNNEAALQSGEKVRFSFGENWRKYLACLNDARIQQARRSLQNSFADFDLADHRFIDVGCGSGLFSLCALRAGANEVASIDVDPNSVECAIIQVHPGESRKVVSGAEYSRMCRNAAEVVGALVVNNAPDLSAADRIDFRRSDARLERRRRAVHGLVHPQRAKDMVEDILIERLA